MYPLVAPTLAADFVSRLGPSIAEILRGFVSPGIGFKLPAGLVTGLLVGGVFLAATGMVVASFGKGKRAKIWVPVGVAVGGILAGWALTAGRKDVSNFFVVIALVLSFLGGLTFLVGLLRTPWIPLGLALAVVVSAAGWVDAFRALHPDEPGHYTWWRQWGGAREGNVGWRIDYVLASPAAMRFVRGAYLSPEVSGSDHCPAVVELDPRVLG